MRKRKSKWWGWGGGLRKWWKKKTHISIIHTYVVELLCVFVSLNSLPERCSMTISILYIWRFSQIAVLSMTRLEKSARKTTEILASWHWNLCKCGMWHVLVSLQSECYLLLFFMIRQCLRWILFISVMQSNSLSHVVQIDAWIRSQLFHLNDDNVQNCFHKKWKLWQAIILLGGTLMAERGGAGRCRCLGFFPWWLFCVIVLLRDDKLLLLLDSWPW